MLAGQQLIGNSAIDCSWPAFGQVEQLKRPAVLEVQQQSRPYKVITAGSFSASAAIRCRSSGDGDAARVRQKKVHPCADRVRVLRIWSGAGSVSVQRRGCSRARANCEQLSILPGTLASTVYRCGSDVCNRPAKLLSCHSGHSPGCRTRNSLCQNQGACAFFGVVEGKDTGPSALGCDLLEGMSNRSRAGLDVCPTWSVARLCLGTFRSLRVISGCSIAQLQPWGSCITPAFRPDCAQHYRSSVQGSFDRSHSRCQLAQNSCTPGARPPRRLLGLPASIAVGVSHKLKIRKIGLHGQQLHYCQS